MPATTDVPLEAIYRTTSLLEALVQIPIAPTFLRDRLFGVVQTTEADLVSIEFYRGRQKLAPFCSRYSKGIAMAREKTQLSLFAPPFLKPNRMLHADDVLRRSGNRANGSATNRDAELLVIDTQELDASISRTENWMCSQVLFSGKVVCRDGDSQESSRKSTMDRSVEQSPRNRGAIRLLIPWRISRPPSAWSREPLALLPTSS